MHDLAVAVTAAMIRCVALPAMWRRFFCEVCGESMAHATESGDFLCGGCLVERRNACRAQNRSASVNAVRAQVAREFADRRQERRLAREFEGDVDAVDLFKDGYFDRFYGEWSASETFGPKPRWVA